MVALFKSPCEDRKREEIIGKKYIKQYLSLNAVLQTIVGIVEKGQILMENGIVEW